MTFWRKQHFELSSSVATRGQEFILILIAISAKIITHLDFGKKYIYLILYMMSCSLLFEKSKWNLRATCTISHTSRNTTRFICAKFSKSTISTLHCQRDDSHVWVGKLLLLCAGKEFTDKYLEKCNYGSI